MLSYKDWYEFSLRQRCHKNFLEQVTIIVFLMLVVGFVFPIVAITLAAIRFVFRFDYIIHYRRGPVYRYVGEMPIYITHMLMMVMAIVTCSLWISQIPNL